jgi:hypothetical protein
MMMRIDWPCFICFIKTHLKSYFSRYYGELVGDPSDSNNNTCGGDDAVPQGEKLKKLKKYKVIV